FNLEGWLNYGGYKEVRTFTQVYRDGRVEAACTRIAPLQNDSRRVLLDPDCELTVMELVCCYQQFCKAVHLEPPFQVFSALTGCRGAKIFVDHRYGELWEIAIDRDSVFLPDITWTDLENNATEAFRPWCDMLAQVFGIEHSPNFSPEGKWHDRIRNRGRQC